MPCFSVVSKPVQCPANHESSNKNINKRYSQLAFLYDKLNLAGNIVLLSAFLLQSGTGGYKRRMLCRKLTSGNARGENGEF